MMIIMGDTHGEWGKLNSQLNKLAQKHKEPIDIIICGDFGYFPSEKEYSLDLLKIPDGVKLYFCPGNHEDWDKLDAIERNSSEKVIEIHPNVFYCTFGSVLNFEGKNFLFCGGAESVDKQYRTIGYDWFPQETISESDFYKLPNPDDIKIDVVISHTCPDFLTMDMLKKILYVTSKREDVSTRFLTEIHSMYKPKWWFFGHFHHHMSFFKNGTSFECLDHLGGESVNMIKLQFLR